MDHGRTHQQTPRSQLVRKTSKTSGSASTENRQKWYLRRLRQGGERVLAVSTPWVSSLLCPAGALQMCRLRLVNGLGAIPGLQDKASCGDRGDQTCNRRHRPPPLQSPARPFYSKKSSLIALPLGDTTRRPTLQAVVSLLLT